LSQGSAFNLRNAPKSVAAHLPQAIGLTHFTEATVRDISHCVYSQWPRFCRGSADHYGVFVRCVARRLASDRLQYSESNYSIWEGYIFKFYIGCILCSDLFILVLKCFAFLNLALTFQRISRKHCLQVVGPKMRSLT